MKVTSWKTLRSCRGVTLVELLVGLVVGAILILAVIAAWSLTARTATFTMSSARLNHDLRAMMQTISQDLRRADGGSGISAFQAVQFGANGQCITYFVEEVPRGFRMTADGVFEMYFTPDTVLLIPCDGNPDGNWIPVYDSLAQGGLVITAFQVGWQATCYPFNPIDPVRNFDSSTSAINEPRCDGMQNYTEVLEVSLMLTGQFGTGAQVKSATLNQSVTVRNNLIRDTT